LTAQVEATRYRRHVNMDRLLSWTASDAQPQQEPLVLAYTLVARGRGMLTWKTPSRAYALR
jgi:hypothetical protein